MNQETDAAKPRPQKKSVHLAIVIPVYNEGEVIKDVVNLIPEKIRGADKISILCINDGSTDSSAQEIKKTKARLISLPVNLGVGLATYTGLEAAKAVGADVVATIDGDGQHDPSEIEKLIRPILDGSCDLAIGARLIERASMPSIKRFGNWAMNFITYLVSGSWVSDSQSGMKAFSPRALEAIQIKTRGYELCSEIIMLAKSKGLVLQEVPIKAIYSEHSTRKGQSPLNGVNIALKLFYKKITG